MISVLSLACSLPPDGSTLTHSLSEKDLGSEKPCPVVRRKKISEPNAEKSFTSTDHQILMTADPIKLSKEEVCFYKQFLEARRDCYKFLVNNIAQ